MHHKIVLSSEISWKKKSNMDDLKYDRLETKIDKLDDRLDNINLILVKNTDLLDIHIKRTDALEEYVKEEVVKRDLDPIKAHVNDVKAAMRVLKWIGGAVVAILGLLLTLKQLGIL